MDTNQDRREYDRDQNQQQNQNQDQHHRNQDRSGSFNNDNDRERNQDRDQNNDQDRRDQQQSSNYNLGETERRWNEINTDYRRRYPNLTSEDVDFRQGEFDNMTDRIAQKTNRSRLEVQDEIKNWNSDSYDRE